MFLIIGAIDPVFHLCFKQQKPQPPRYEDKNHDGIEDMIVDEEYNIGMFWPLNRTQEKVLYGATLNGKRVYLPEEILKKYGQ